MRRGVRLAAFAIVIPSAAEGHAFAQRYDLPLPLWHYIAGAGAAVAFSFAIMAVVMRRGEPSAPRWSTPLPAPVTKLAERVIPLASAFIFGLLLAAGFLGEQGDWDSNILPVTIWVAWWVGVTLVSALVGGVWPLIDPWRALARMLPHREPPLPWPRRLQAWPAVLLFFLFAWAELAWTENAVPRKLAAVVLAYSILAWSGTALFGSETWRGNADPFARYFGLFARFAPLAFERGRLLVRPFGAGLQQREPPSAATAGFVILALATVSFDGIAETPFWETLVGAITGFLYDAGVVRLVGYTAVSSLIKTLGLVAAPLLLATLYLATCALVGRFAGESPGLAARRYVLSLVPIAIGYHLAHYLSYLLIQGQAIIPLLSDPLNLGWDLFGTRGYQIDIGIVGMRFVWLFAVAAIVTGHVAAVTLAHAEALRVAPARNAAVASQVPMTVLMVAYTMLGLWILSQPIVEV